MAEKKQKNKTEEALTLLARKDILLSDKAIAKEVGCTV